MSLQHPMSVLIIGASGLAGQFLREAFRAGAAGPVYGTCRSRRADHLRPLDVTDGAAVRTLLEQLRPHVVVLSAALTNVDYCETHPDEAAAVNVAGARNVAEAAARCGAACLVYLSTDYVFDGKAGPYPEEDPPNPINYYGYTKLLAEEIVRNYEGRALIVRTTGLFGWQPGGKNYVMQLIDNLTARRAMRVPADQYGTPAYAPDLARAIVHLVAAGRSGIFHAGGTDFLNRYRFACLAADRLGLDKHLLVPVETNQLGQAAARPLRAGLRSGKLPAAGFSMRPLEHCLQEVAGQAVLARNSTQCQE